MLSIRTTKFLRSIESPNKKGRVDIVSIDKKFLIILSVFQPNKLSSNKIDINNWYFIVDMSTELEIIRDDMLLLINLNWFDLIDELYKNELITKEIKKELEEL
jgi:hypothetical protein